MAAGIGMVTQEFSLVETMTVRENVALSGVGLGRVDVRAHRTRVAEAMERIGVHLEPERLVSTLSIGERQRVEIVKALIRDAKVLILDEPTAVLTPQETDDLMEVMRTLKAAGTSIVRPAISCCSAVKAPPVAQRYQLSPPWKPVRPNSVA